ncbi:MAG: aldehyde dehydrogenase family protein [Proteobacteria bacterium]|nr:aldehyde dehydrogenase family protein [Pseudomonadota bacterium]
MGTSLINPNKLIEQTIELAEQWQNRANQLINNEEKQIQQKMQKMLSRPLDKITLVEMLDQSFRSNNHYRVAQQINYLLSKYGIPSFFSTWEMFLVQVYLKIGKYFPQISIPLMKKRLKQETRLVIIPGEEELLKEHLRVRKKQGVQMNVNHLGEAILGEHEAQARLNTYIKSLQSPDIEYISVKISTIYSQINTLAFDQTLNILVERFSLLFKTAQENRFIRHDGKEVNKFVNLDMEEYRDMDITIAAFKRTLDKPQFNSFRCGIVLQAYLPDAFQKLEELTTWAIERRSHGGAPIKVRIVKGANMEMEQFEAHSKGWDLAPYDDKIDVDANYKKMVNYGTQPEHIEAVHLGIASHNLFELAFAYTVAKSRNVTKYIRFEMLEGMADHVRRAINEITGEVLIYAPDAKEDQFINAIAYLVRRLDENTSDENFLRYSFNLKVGSNEWKFLSEQFVESVGRIEKVKSTPNRDQNRLTEDYPEKMWDPSKNKFYNEVDTDFNLPSNRQWADNIRHKWQKSADDEPIMVAAVIAGKEIIEREQRQCYDTSQNNQKIVVASYPVPTFEDAELAVKTAKEDPDGWRQLSVAERGNILFRIAIELRKLRADLIGVAAACNGKVFTETDVEISEAIDFAGYYIHSLKKFDQLGNLSISSKGVGLVIPPWNFPIAIPCGGVLAALATGNTVILKPAATAIPAAWIFCQAFWNAGVSRNSLQFLPSPSNTGVPAKLVEHRDIDFVILTGGTDTALGILENRPALLLAAETGGKDATIVTSMADRDLAIKNIVHSAFSNAGQKCSATSLLILEKELYDNIEFQQQLVDAVKSYNVGSVWKLENKVGPMNSIPSGDLKRAFEALDPGEYWALKPESLNDNPYLWSPGIKWDVAPGSYSHMTEFFGPVLSVMKADNLDHAIALVNQTGFGLTSGLESLDEREQKTWKEKIRAGNLYINRVTTGAIVLRQPFGGMGKSAIGAGIKCGGPNYVTQFVDFEELESPSYKILSVTNSYELLAQDWEERLSSGNLSGLAGDLEKSIHAIRSYLYQNELVFSKEVDVFKIPGQDNILKYLTIGTILVRVHEADTLFDLISRIAAVKISGNHLILSFPHGVSNFLTEFISNSDGLELLQGTKVIWQSDQELVDQIPSVQRIRYAAPDRVPELMLKEAAKTGFYISKNPPLMEGRIELLQYYQEQSISFDYHRYGNLGARSL